MSGVELAVVITALGNVVLGLWGLFNKKKVKTVSDGLLAVEAAIEENKTVINKLPHGKAVTATIEEYGPVVHAAVNVARRVANEVAKKGYVAGIIEKERLKHAAREAKKLRR